MRTLPALSLLLAVAAPAQTTQQPVRAVTDPGVITTRQTITPAGIPLVFQGRTYGAAFTPDGRGLWVLNQTQVYEIDWRSGRILANLPHNGAAAYQGIVTSGGKPFVAVTARRGNPGLFVMNGSKLEPLAANLGKHNLGGPGVGADRGGGPGQQQGRQSDVLESGDHDRVGNKNLQTRSSGANPGLSIDLTQECREKRTSRWAFICPNCLSDPRRG